MELYEMDELEYKEKILNTDIPDINYISEMLSETWWYLSEEKDRKFFAQNAFGVIKNHINHIDKVNLIGIMSRLQYFEITDYSLLENLMQKSIEFNAPILTPYHTHFDIFTKEEKAAYVKMLNNINYSDFSHFKYKISVDRNHSLSNIYRSYYYSSNSDTNKEIACENFNLFILSETPELFFNNTLINKEIKKNLFEKFMTNDESGVNLYGLFSLLRNKTVDAIDVGLIPPVISKVCLQTAKYNRKNNVIDLFEILNKSSKDLVDESLNAILNIPENKQGLISILKEKINLPRDHDIKAFDNKIKGYSNINLLQYLMLNKPNDFITELCKRDKDFMSLFNNCIHETVGGFDYERHPLDLVLKGDVLSSSIEDLYVYKIINNDLRPKMKDKVCAVLFHSISNYVTSDHKYNSILNAVSLMPPTLINKYFIRYKDTFSERKYNDTEIIKNMVNLQKAVPEKNDEQQDKPKSRPKI
jgi:hypothetical protein